MRLFCLVYLPSLYTARALLFCALSCVIGLRVLDASGQESLMWATRRVGAFLGRTPPSKAHRGASINLHSVSKQTISPSRSFTSSSREISLIASTHAANRDNLSRLRSALYRALLSYEVFEPSCQSTCPSTPTLSARTKWYAAKRTPKKMTIRMTKSLTSPSPISCLVAEQRNSARRQRVGKS